MEKNTTGTLRTKAMLNFKLSSILNGDKNAPLIYPTLEVPAFIRNDSLTSDESKTKDKRPFVNT